MSGKMIKQEDIHYDLKKPCKDCPFLQDSPVHSGILKSIPDIVYAIENGNLVHTCHKTDPIAANPAPRNVVGSKE